MESVGSRYQPYGGFQAQQMPVQQFYGGEQAMMMAGDAPQQMMSPVLGQQTPGMEHMPVMGHHF